MKEPKWREEDIEDLLAKAPKVEDHRSKEDVLKRLQQEGLIQKPKRKKSRYVAYGLTAAMTCIVAGGIYVWTQPSFDTASNEEKATSGAETSAFTSMDVSEAESRMLSDYATNTNQSPLRTAVYAEEMVDYVPFTIGLAGDAAESVPVTMLIPREEVLEAFGEEPTKLELYEKYAPFVDEQAAGFSDYHPLKGQLVENGTVLQHTLPTEHGYDLASATMAMYTGALMDTFSDSYTEVQMLGEDGEAITFSQAGEPSEPLLLEAHYSYFLDEQPNGLFLTPNFRQSFASVTEALLAMKVTENDIYQSAILDGVDYTAQAGEVTTITFTSPVDVEQYDAQALMRMLEAMLLTAAEFDQQIQFENIVQSEWQGFDFSAPLPQPIGANRLSLDYLQKN